MIRNFKTWKQQRRQARQRRKAKDPNSYPRDMDRDVVETIASVTEYSMTSAERLHGLCEAVRYLCRNGIAGDIVECGVWRGGSMMAIAKMLRSQGDQSRHLYLCDTFEGMSEPSDKDVSAQGETAQQLLGREDPADPHSVWCVSSLGEVQTHMATTGYPTDHIHYCVGKVEETIPAAAPQRIALLRLDTDWYESTAHELLHLFPRLVDGGILIVDDYGHWEGARRAVDEYFQRHGIGMMLHRLDYTGRIGVHHAAVQRVDRSHAQGQRCEAA